MSPQQPGPRPAELRIALAMRGGVSLAVWMGGSCCEVAALREKAGVYGPLLSRCRYTDVTVDVLAGTSAGGLNGVLLSCHLLYGMPFEAGVRNLWLKLGDLESLLRGTPRPNRVPDSLLRGDEAFYARLRLGLDELMEHCDPPAERPASLRLILTATRLRPRPDWVRPTLGQPLLTGRSRAYFRFRHRSPAGAPTPSLTDFPADPEERKEALNRLAYAARATSSFPGAFEPAQPVVDAPPTRATDPPRPPNLWGVSSETGSPDPASGGTVELVDGGLLDNIPVAWAVRAIAGSPADQGVDRWLLFLQPVPPYADAPVAKAGRRGVTRLLRLARKSLGIKAGTESLLDDVTEFQGAEDIDERHKGLVGVLPADPASCARAATRRWSAYLTGVGDAEARRVSLLLQDPTKITGPDPLPLPSGPGPLDFLDERLPDGSAPFLAALCRTGEHWVPPPGTSWEDLPATGQSPMMPARAVRLLLDWLRAFEAQAYEDRPGTTRDGPATAEDSPCAAMPPELPELRKRLYAHRLAVATLIAARDRTILHEFGVGLAHRTNDPLELKRRATLRLERLLPGRTDQGWEAWASDLAAAVTTDAGVPCAHPAPRSASSYRTLCASLFESLAELGRDMGPVLTRAAADGCRSTTVPGFQALHKAAVGARGDMRKVLAAAEVLLGPLRPDPLAEPTHINFHTVSAANTSWATEYLAPAPGGTATLRGMVEGKLSGNQLNNFSAFLSARWRISDWTWGRLDGAASLVKIVATDDRLRTAFGDPDDGLMDRVVTALAPSVDWLPGQLGDTTRGTSPLTPYTALAGLWENTPAGTGPWDRVRHLLVELRQREILKQELPVVAALRKQPGGGNPPAVPAKTPPVAFDTAFREFRRIGEETVPELLRAHDPRRAAVRLGLLAWPALEPSGNRWKAFLGRGVMWALKPFVWLPVVLAVLAPLLAVCAGSLMWVGVAFSTQRWFSPPGHLVLALCVAPASVVGFLIRSQGARWRSRLPRILGWLGLALLPAVVLTTVLCLVLGTGPGHVADDASELTRQLIVGATMLAAASALLWAGVQGRVHALCLLLVAVAAGGAAFLLQAWADGEGAWPTLLVLYAVLTAVSLALNWLRPRTAS
ncbi:DUF3376 domain-containing protein [Streptomyces spectabilis]|uniref:DUF3376 domain-containing protein n=1 Tax=Streptomyces spectabilis TaxID=68270 RepID=UPI00340308B1